MRKFVIFFAMALAVFVSCSTLKSGEQTVVFEGNPTTGYQWTCSIEDEGIVALKSDQYSMNKSKPGMVGVGGHWDFVLAPVSDGSTTITFSYARNWEKEAIDKKVFLATVSNGSLSLKPIN